MLLQIHAYGQGCTCGSFGNSSGKGYEILKRTEMLSEIRKVTFEYSKYFCMVVCLQLFDLEANKETQQFQTLVAAMISSQTRDAVTGAAMQRLRAMSGGLTIAQIASDAIEVDALAEILKPVGFYRCVLIFCVPSTQRL